MPKRADAVRFLIESERFEVSREPGVESPLMEPVVNGGGARLSGKVGSESKESPRMNLRRGVGLWTWSSMEDMFA